ncbi:MAG: hypothetical protein DRP64_15375 [Verrucomicrobia bacterium]|nr:MAG: hypothetical protein DRP64_15375 [Verrucomicrobiota bacterium]
MSRQTSLQRADHQSPECHHLFPVVGIRSKSEAKIVQNIQSKKIRSSAETRPPCQKQTSKNKID